MSWASASKRSGYPGCLARLALLEVVLEPIQNHPSGTRRTRKTQRTLFVFLFVFVFVWWGCVLWGEGGGGAASSQCGIRPTGGSH